MKKIVHWAWPVAERVRLSKREGGVGAVEVRQLSPPGDHPSLMTSGWEQALMRVTCSNPGVGVLKVADLTNKRGNDHSLAIVSSGCYLKHHHETNATGLILPCLIPDDALSFTTQPAGIDARQNQLQYHSLARSWQIYTTTTTAAAAASCTLALRLRPRLMPMSMPRLV